MRDWLSKLFAPYGAETKKVQMTFFFGAWALLTAIGLFIPQAVLTDNPSLRAFTDFMASFIPQIDRVTALDLRPEVNRLHYSILWAVSPVFIVLTLIGLYKGITAKEKISTTYGQAFGALFACIWLIGWTMFLWHGLGFVDDPHNRIARVMFYHGLSRAIYAPVMVAVFWAAVGAIMYLAWGFITGRFHRATDGATNEGKSNG